jgi:hypothetical protein
MEQHGVDVQFNRQQNIFVVGIDKDDRGVDSNSAYYFVIIPINASSVVGVSSEIVSKTTYYYPLITSSEAVAVDTSSVAITHDGLYSI